MRGRDIKRYSYDYADLYIIATFPSKHYDIENYPAVKNYLLTYGIERLEQTGKTYQVNGQYIKARKKTNNKWFETQDSISYSDDFSKQKIVWGEISDKPKFAIDIYGSYYISNTVFMMTGSNLPYITAILNSPLSEYYFSQVATTTGEGTVRWLKYKIECFPIPPISSIQNDEFEKMIISEEHSESWYSKIEQMVYRLYNMTSEEIAYISDYLSRDKM